MSKNLDQMIQSTKLALEQQAEQARIDELAREAAQSEFEQATAELAYIYDSITIELSRLLTDKGIPKEAIGRYIYDTHTERTGFFGSKEIQHKTVRQEPVGEGWVIFFHDSDSGDRDRPGYPGEALYLRDDGQLVFRNIGYRGSGDTFLIGNLNVAKLFMSIKTNDSRGANKSKELLANEIEDTFRPLLEKVI